MKNIWEFDFELEAKQTMAAKSIFRLRCPQLSATAAVGRWVEEGGKVSMRELRRIARDLRRAQRYKPALEIFSWMESKCTSQLSAFDHAMRLELIEKIHGLAKAEAYFEELKDGTSKKAACLPLLSSYLKGRNVVSAEAFMKKLQNLGLLVIPQPFNEMMKLYLSIGQYEKVSLVFQKMKRENIPRNVLSYNLLMRACNEVHGVPAVEKVYEEMMADNTVGIGWSTYVTLANIYTGSGFHDKAFAALRAAEDTLSTKNRLPYFFIITIYANLQSRDGILRVWASSKKVAGRMSCANYMCIMLCLVKVDELGETEKIFRNWESECRKYDIRVSNVLLGAYVRKGWIKKAESFHLHTLKNGGVPNYKTWEILMEGWVKSNQMDRAVKAMEKGFSMLKYCHWRPPPTITIAIAEYFEDGSRLEDARKYVKVLRHLNAMNLPLYKSYVRTHIKVQAPIPDVLKMIRTDKVSLDDEIMSLIQQASTVLDANGSDSDREQSKGSGVSTLIK